MKARIIPPPLKKGDCISVIAPAGQLASIEHFREGLTILQDFGFILKFPAGLWPGHGFLADDDVRRADEFNRALIDEDSQAILALRGGYGCLRMLDKITVELVRERPKMLVGFSDITILQNYLFHVAGLLSLHGPVLTTLHTSTPAALERFFHCLNGAWQGALTYPRVEILRGKRNAEGPLIGGNLTSLTSLLGTPFDFSWEGCIVLLEDTNEPAYRLDRMLTQLFHAGKLDQVTGILLGDFSLSDQSHEVEKLRYTEYIWARVLDLTTRTQIPVWAGLPSGHCAENLTLPIGAAAVMHNGSAALHFS